MNLLILGLIAFLGIHSARVFAEAPRQALIARLGPMAWKGLYSLVSLLGLVLMVQGYGQARLEPVVVWVPPVGMRPTVGRRPRMPFMYAGQRTAAFFAKA